MKTVPLHGKKARGRVARVDDGDYDLVMQYRWYVKEVPPEPGKRGCGPYAVTSTSILMHCLIMGIKGVDHRDHDGLNNQRSNLRPATQAQNMQNRRSQPGSTSTYKGVFWNRRSQRWQAKIKTNGRSRTLGLYVSEAEAALAYDEAAREMFGEYACLNFPDGVPQDVRDQLRAEREAAKILAAARMSREQSARSAVMWEQREPETRVCTVCGDAYLTRAMMATLYCSGRCEAAARRRRNRQRQQEGRLF